MDKKTVRDIALTGKTVLVRVDYNVPFRPGTAEIADDTRIRASLPTVRYLIEQQCRVVLSSHLGRPKGVVVDGLRMRPIAIRLSELLGPRVGVASDCIGPEVRGATEALRPGEVLVLENLRFHPEEEADDPDFAKELASVAEMFVNDAFGAAHRAHASTVGVTHYLPAVAGFLMARELEMLGKVVASPERPVVAVLGGAKVSDKLAVLRNLVERVDTLVIGGGMAATFLKALGLEVGDSLVEDELVTEAADLMRGAGERLVLPEDIVIADAFSEDAGVKVVRAEGIPAGWRAMDIGPRTAESFVRVLEPAKTVVWNGPMGVFEWTPFAEGTRRVARAVAGLANAITIIGGGSTAEAVVSLGLESKMTHVSTGGGASLELLEGRTLPGVAALLDRV